MSSIFPFQAYVISSHVLHQSTSNMSGLPLNKQSTQEQTYSSQNYVLDLINLVHSQTETSF